MTFVEEVPETIEDGIREQEDDPSFAEFLHDLQYLANRNGLHVWAKQTTSNPSSSFETRNSE